MTASHDHDVSAHTGQLCGRLGLRCSRAPDVRSRCPAASSAATQARKAFPVSGWRVMRPGLPLGPQHPGAGAGQCHQRGGPQSVAPSAPRRLIHAPWSPRYAGCGQWARARLCCSCSCWRSRLAATDWQHVQRPRRLYCGFLLLRRCWAHERCDHPSRDRHIRHQFHRPRRSLRLDHGRLWGHPSQF